MDWAIDDLRLFEPYRPCYSLWTRPMGNECGMQVTECLEPRNGQAVNSLLIGMRSADGCLSMDLKKHKMA